MPLAPGHNRCPTCGLPYLAGTKASHDLKGSHRIAALTAGVKAGKVDATAAAPPAESFGQRMARTRREKAAQAAGPTAAAAAAASGEPTRGRRSR